MKEPQFPDRSIEFRNRISDLIEAGETPARISAYALLQLRSIAGDSYEERASKHYWMTFYLLAEAIALESRR